MLVSDEPTYRTLKLLLLQVPFLYNFFALAVLVLGESVWCVVVTLVGFFCCCCFCMLVTIPVSSADLQCS